MKCSALFVPSYKITIEDTKTTFSSANEAFKQYQDIEPARFWLLMEQLANNQFYMQPTHPVQVRVASPSKQSKHVSVLKSANLSIQSNLTKQHIPWLIHPLNSSSSVPHQNEVVSVDMAYLTSSRSNYIFSGPFKDYTIRLSTDKPHWNGSKQDKLNVESDQALKKSQHIIDTENNYNLTDQSETQLVVLKDVAAVTQPDTDIGYLIRDLKEMRLSFEAGNYIIPAFAIDYIGRDIAALNGAKNKKETEDFWKEHYAKKLGVAKAKLSLYYQVQFETPNMQNILLEFDKNFQPTGRFFFRDLSDVAFVEFLTSSLNLSLDTEKDFSKFYSKKLNPYWSVSKTQRIYDTQTDKWSAEISNKMSEFGRVHDVAFLDFFNQSLGTHFTLDDPQAGLQQLNDYLNSQIGQLNYRNFLSERKK